MRVEWPVVRLGDHADISLGKMLDKEKNRGEYFPYLGNKNVRWGSFDTEDLAQMRFEEHEHQRYGLKYGDLIVCEGGEPGRCAIWKDEVPGMKIQKALHRIRPREGLNYRYLHYWFLWSGNNGSLEPFFTGTTIQHLTGKAIDAINIPLPTLPEQKAIAHILGSLDDKIELNRQMNETLEGIAQVLFKSWFVDFDPVIDKALEAGNPIPDPLQKRAELRLALRHKRKPLPADIDKLFPDSFEFTEELGWVPEGWDVLQMKETAQVVKGTSYKSSELADSNTALVTLKSFQRGGGYRLDGLKPYTGIYKPEQEVVAGDLVVAYTDVTQAADVIGKPAMVIDDARFDHLVVSLDVAVVRPAIGRHKYFLYGEAQTGRFQRHTHSYSTGTTVLHLGKNAVPDYFLLMPDENLLNRYIDIVEPSYQKTNKNIGQLRELEKTRDVLLPKLLSGELRIPDAEKLIQEVI